MNNANISSASPAQFSDSHYCRIQSHSDCDAYICEIKTSVTRATEAEVRIIVIGAYAAIGMAVVVTPILLAMYCWGFVHDKPFAISPQFWEIALGPTVILYAVVGWIKIRKHIPWIKNGKG